MSIKIVNGLAENCTVNINDGSGNLMVSLTDSPEYSVKGDISIESKNAIIVGGHRIECGKPISSIQISGNAGSIQQLPNISVTGTVGSVCTTSGDVQIHGDVSGSVSTVSGDVEIDGNVAGSVSTISGDVDIHNQCT